MTDRAICSIPKVLACLIAVATALTVTGCGDKKNDTSLKVEVSPESASSKSGTTTDSAGSAAAQATQSVAGINAAADAAAVSADDKLNTYIQCFNSTNERAHTAMERYASWVKNMKTGPTGKESIVYGIYTVSESNIEDCDKPLLAAAAAAPAMPALDASAKAYSSAIVAWGKTMNEADKYYSRENYKDDAMAQGKAMHGDIVKNYENFAAASKQYNQALEEANDQRRLVQLAEIEKTEGRKFNYWNLATMASAKQLVNILEQENFDVEEASKRLKSFEETTDNLIEFAKKPESEKPMMWSSMESELENYRTAAKQRLRRVRDKTPYTQGDRMMINANSGWMIDGSPEKIIKSYNDLISRSNSLR